MNFTASGCGRSGLGDGASTPVSTWSPKTAKDTCGRSRPRRTYKVDEYGLGPWVKQQRTDRAEGKLDKDRESRLKELPGWTWNAQATKWEDGLSRLMAYVEQNGHSRVPVAYNTADGYRLGWWARKQRVNYSKGTLDEERQQRLKGLPGWTWKAKSSTSPAPGPAVRPAQSHN